MVAITLMEAFLVFFRFCMCEVVQHFLQLPILQSVPADSVPRQQDHSKCLCSETQLLALFAICTTSDLLKETCCIACVDHSYRAAGAKGSFEFTPVGLTGARAV